MKAMAKATKLIADIAKIPPYMKQVMKEFSDELAEIKSIVDAFKAPGSLEKLAASGKKCADAKIFEPVKCYYHINPNEGATP